MAEEDNKQEESKFDFTLEGEGLGYIGLDQARVLAIRHARENPEFYGQKYSGINMVFELISAEQSDDYYEIKLSFRPAGRFRGEPGVEQFIIDKTGNIEVRQMLDEPAGLDLTESPAAPEAPRLSPEQTITPPEEPTTPPEESIPSEEPDTPVPMPPILALAESKPETAVPQVPTASQDDPEPQAETRPPTPGASPSELASIETVGADLSGFGEKKALAGVVIYALLFTSGVMAYRWFLGDALGYYYGFSIWDWTLHWLAVSVGLGVGFIAIGFLRPPKRFAAFLPILPAGLIPISLIVPAYSSNTFLFFLSSIFLGVGSGAVLAVVNGWMEAVASTKYRRGVTVSLLLGLGMGAAVWGSGAVWLDEGMDLWTAVKVVAGGAAAVAALAVILTRGLPRTTISATPRPKLNLISRWTVLTAPYLATGIVFALATSESMFAHVYGFYPALSQASAALLGAGFVLGGGWVLILERSAAADLEKLRTKRLLLAAFGALALRTLVLQALAPFANRWYYLDTVSLMVFGLSWLLTGLGLGLSLAALSRLKSLGLNPALWAAIGIGAAAVFLGFRWAADSSFDLFTINTVFSSIAGVLAAVGFVFILFSRRTYTQA